MTRVVIDTNVVVSANLVGEGPSAAILDLAANRFIQMFVSEPILAECPTVLRRPRLKLDPAKITAALAVIRDSSVLVEPSSRLRISGDESDNRFYERAEAAGARNFTCIFPKPRLKRTFLLCGQGNISTFP
jgi:putative PIN family toxin of toxin-antitoxin system